MGLRFIMGPSGYGKSYTLYKEMINRSMAEPDNNFIIIVPEQFNLNTQKKVVELHPRHGAMNIDILSFKRLAYRLFEDIGKPSSKVMDQIDKMMLMRKILVDKKDELTVFGRYANKKGFIAEAVNVMSEFMDYSIILDKARKEAEKMAEDKPLLAAKLQDMLLIYDEFKKLKKDGVITDDEIMDALAAAIPQSQMIKDSYIYFDEYTGFTPKQIEVIKMLLQHSKGVCVTLNIDKNGLKHFPPNEYELFYLTKETYMALEKACREAGGVRDEDIILQDHAISRLKDRPAFRHIEKHIFRDSVGFKGDTSCISVCRCMNPDEEMRAIATEIRDLVAKRGYRYKDIAIISGDVSGYSYPAKRYFEANDIPYFIDETSPLSSNACVQLVKSLIQICNENFSYQSVFSCLKTGFTNLTEDEIDNAENYVYYLGIKGVKSWQNEWKYTVKNVFTDDDLKELNVIREKIFMPLSKFRRNFRRKDVRSKTEAVIEYMNDMGVEDKLLAMAENFKSRGQLYLYRQYVQIYSALNDILNKCIDTFGEEAMISDEEFFAMLDEGFKNCTIGIIPTTIDQVVMGDIRRTRLINIKVMFFVGLNDSIVPGAMNTGGIFNDSDKLSLKERNLEISPTSKQNSLSERFYIYNLLTKASDRLYLFYSDQDSAGETIRKSAVLIKLEELFDLNITEWESRSVYEASGPMDLKEYFINSLREKEYEKDRDAFKTALSWMKGKEEYKELGDKLQKANSAHNDRTALSYETANKLYGDEIKGSISLLEKYAGCPYAFFIRYGLGLKERKRFQIEAVDLGTVYHAALKIFFDKLYSHNEDLKTIDDDLRDQLVELAVDLAVDEYSAGLFKDTERNKYFIIRMKRVCKRTVMTLQKQFRKGRFNRIRTEIPFSSETVDDPGYYVLNKGRIMKLSGSIDRMDTCDAEDKIFVKIIDYKSSDHDFDLCRLYSGEDIQLPIYMKAAVSRVQRENPGRDAEAAGMFFYHIDDPLVKDDGRKYMDDEAAAEELSKMLRMKGIVKGDEDVLKLIDEEGSSKASEVIVTGRNSDNTFLSAEEFDRFIEFAEKKAIRMSEDIFAGNIKAEPCGDACDYCNYNGICGMAAGIPEYKKRKVPKDSKKAKELILKEVDSLDDKMDRSAAEGN